MALGWVCEPNSGNSISPETGELRDGIDLTRRYVLELDS